MIHSKFAGMYAFSRFAFCGLLEPRIIFSLYYYNKTQMPAAKSTKSTKAATKPRTSKNAKLAERLDGVIDMLKSGKPSGPAVTKLEAIKAKLVPKGKSTATREPTEYQKFVKKNWSSVDGKDAPSKMKAIAALWKAKK